MASQRKRSSAVQGDTADGHRKRFAYLKPRIRRVTKRTIRSRWTTLPEAVQEKVQDMFRSLERPVIVRHRDERKRIEAQTAVGIVVKK
jgi:kinetochore protein Fta7